MLEDKQYIKGSAKNPEEFFMKRYLPFNMNIFRIRIADFQPFPHKCSTKLMTGLNP